MARTTLAASELSRALATRDAQKIYWALTAGFLFLHILLLDETDRVPASPTLRRLVIAALVSPTVATVVMLTFERIFLVRLP